MMLKKILIAVAVIIVVLLVVFVSVVAMQPADFRLSRSIKISAPAAAVFEQVNDFHNWEKWSPWAKLDPAMKLTFAGPPAGKDAIYAWVGNDEVGEGRMTITESRPSDLLRIKLEFMKPFAATNTAEFTFQPDGDQTVATWSMFGKCDFMMKAFHLFVDMDSLLGSEFEKGLADMKSAAENISKS